MSNRKRTGTDFSLLPDRNPQHMARLNSAAMAALLRFQATAIRSLLLAAERAQPDRGRLGKDFHPPMAPHSFGVSWAVELLCWLVERHLTEKKDLSTLSDDFAGSLAARPGSVIDVLDPTTGFDGFESRQPDIRYRSDLRELVHEPAAGGRQRRYEQDQANRRRAHRARARIRQVEQTLLAVEGSLAALEEEKIRKAEEMRRNRYGE